MLARRQAEASSKEFLRTSTSGTMLDYPSREWAIATNCDQQLKPPGVTLGLEFTNMPCEIWALK